MSGQADSGPQTIDQVTTSLSEWAKQVTQVADVSQEPPETSSCALGVSVYLLDVVRKPPLRGPRRPPLQVWLRYLVSASGQEPTAVHHTLHQLVFAALARPDLEVEETPVPAQLWSALGTVPRPAFVLRYPLRVEQHELSVPLVRQANLRPIVASPTLHGRLLVPHAGPAGETIGLAAARVEAPGTRRSATTDHSGYFRLENVLPDADGSIRLRVQAKGHTFETTVHETGTAGAPATIKVPLPVARLAGRLEDGSGRPLPGVRIELPSRRQYVNTRADGRFIVDGLPADLSLDQIVASQGGERLAVRTHEGVLVLTSGNGSSAEPVFLELE